MAKPSTSLRDIVLENFNNASIMEKYGFDYCCNGGVSLKRVCAMKGLDPESIIHEFSATIHNGPPQDFRSWDIPLLIDHICNHHHSYIRKQIPHIILHQDKVILKHGDKYPEMKEVAAIFRIYSKELEQHLLQEENNLFPFILELAANVKFGSNQQTSYLSDIKKPIDLMKKEHTEVGKELDHIRRLLKNYVPPDDTCATMQTWYKELEAFEYDLHKHVFLENAILFPKALELEKEFMEVSMHLVH